MFPAGGGIPSRSHLVIKAQLGNDIRKIPIHNEELTCDELLLMMQRIFKGHLGSNDEVTIKYKDSDNDLVTITDNTDLSFAIESCRGDSTLRLILFVNDQPKPMETDEVKMLRKELCEIRNRVNYLLDTLDTSRQQTPDPTLESSVSDEHPQPQVQVTENQEIGSKVAMFDPLKSRQTNVSTDDHAHTANKVASAFGLAPEEITGSRSGSPNSLSSHGSSKLPKQQQQQQSQLISSSYPNSNSTEPQGAQFYSQQPTQAAYPDHHQSAPVLEPSSNTGGYNPVGYPVQSAPPGSMGGAPRSQGVPVPMGGGPGLQGVPVPMVGPVAGSQGGPMVGGPAPVPMGGAPFHSSHPFTNTRPGEPVYSQPTGSPPGSSPGQTNPYLPQSYYTSNQSGPPEPITAPPPGPPPQGWNPTNVYQPGYPPNPNVYQPGNGQYAPGAIPGAPAVRGSSTCPGSPNPYSRQQRGPAVGHPKAYQPGYQ